jgi:hypothetical protein
MRKVKPNGHWAVTIGRKCPEPLPISVDEFDTVPLCVERLRQAVYWEM